MVAAKTSFIRMELIIILNQYTHNNAEYLAVTQYILIILIFLFYSDEFKKNLLFDFYLGVFGVIKMSCGLLFFCTCSHIYFVI